MKRFFITAIFFLLSAFYMWGQTVSTYEYEIGSYDDYYYDGYTISGNEAIEYIITLPCRMLLTVSHCNSSGYNYTELKFGDQMIIENCGTGQNAALKQFSQVLDAGTYRFISSGSPQEEDALLDIVVFVEKTGATFNGSTSPIEAGILNNGSAVEYTRNGLDYTDS